MAITSISRLQHRRGLKTDLPVELYEGELGWCLDTRELFIGNGPTFSGNSQILTQWSPNSNIITHVYQGYTGIAATTGAPGQPVVRPIGAIFDDWISVKDYGAVGDGIADDTEAINRAIADRWLTVPVITGPNTRVSMSAIRFPAGTYRITSSINLYPYVALIGEGVGRSIIFMDQSNDPAVIRTADSLGNTSGNIGANGAVLPSYIYISGFTIDNTYNPLADGIQLQRVSNPTISDVEIYSSWTTGQGTANNSAGIRLQTLGTLYLNDNTYMRNVEIAGFVYGMYCNDPVRFTVADNIKILNCYQGVNIGDDTVTLDGPSYFRITNSTFNDIDDHGLVVNSPNPGIISNNNVYENVGEVNAVEPIYFGLNTQRDGSVSDVFSRLSDTRIFVGNPDDTTILTPQQMSIQSNRPFTLGPFTLLANQPQTPTGVTIDGGIYTVVFFNYSIIRGTTMRAGTLTILTDGITAGVNDTGFDFNGSPGITFYVTAVNDIVSLDYSSDNSGPDARFKYIETKWDLR